MITNQLKWNKILGRLLYVIRSLLQVGFRFQYQLINSLLSIRFNINSSLSIDFFSFSWSQSRPQSNFKELKTSFSSYSYNKKMRWGQGLAEASLSPNVFSKKKKIFYCSFGNQRFIYIAWKRKQTTTPCMWINEIKWNKTK